MALASKCPKCDGTGFESVIEQVKGSDEDLALVRCARCGCVVGVLEQASILRQLRKIQDGLKQAGIVIP